MTAAQSQGPEAAVVRSQSVRSRLTPVAVILVLAAAVAFVHGRDLESMWRSDDGFVLDFVTRYSPWQYFFVPAYTGGFDPVSVSPWLALVYDINIALFGVNPVGFYLHQLAAVLAVAVLIYLLLRRWIPELDAAAGALLFVVGATTMFAAKQLMVAHYAYGLVFSLLSLLFYVHALRSRSTTAWATSLLFFALALTCKELYVPLPFVLLVLPEGRGKDRVRLCLPYFVLLGLYALWRHAVLGTFLGGYRSGEMTWSDLVNSLQTFVRLPSTLLGHGPLLMAALVAVVGVAVAAIVRRRINIPFALVLLAVTLLPLVPLGVLSVVRVPDRFFFLVWVVFACAVAWGAATAVPSALLRALAYAAISVASYVNLVHFRPEFGDGQYAEIKKFYGFFLGSSSGQVLVIDKSAPYLNNVLNGVSMAYARLDVREGHAEVLGRDELTYLHMDPAQPVWAWSPPCRCLAPSTVAAQRSPTPEMLWTPEQGPLSVEVAYEPVRRVMRWQAGPHTRGVWTIRFEAAPNVWMIKFDRWRPAGGANIFWPEAVRPFRFFVRFESTQGWALRSPVLTFTPANQPRFSWASPG